MSQIENLPGIFSFSFDLLYIISKINSIHLNNFLKSHQQHRTIIHLHCKKIYYNFTQNFVFEKYKT